jgi:hypothetical protein
MAESRGRKLAGEAFATWRALGFEQKVAAVGSVLLVVSTFGPFSFVEAAQLLVAIAVLALLRQRAQGRSFQLPMADGTLLMTAGAWAGLLIVVRLFDRPLGQNLLALACAAILVVAGAAERAKHPPEGLRLEEPPQPAEPPVPAPSRGTGTPQSPGTTPAPGGAPEGSPAPAQPPGQAPGP